VNPSGIAYEIKVQLCGVTTARPLKQLDEPGCGRMVTTLQQRPGPGHLDTALGLYAEQVTCLDGGGRLQHSARGDLPAGTNPLGKRLSGGEYRAGPGRQDQLFARAVRYAGWQARSLRNARPRLSGATPCGGRSGRRYSE
jgi:hypothetical protein